jgi:hypothetical protein
MLPVKSHIKGKEIIDPEMAVFIKLDELQRALQKEFKAQRDIMVQLLNTDMLIHEHLKHLKTNALVQEIVKWREAWQDAGEYRYIEDTATTNATEYILAADFEYPLKGYMIINDGDNTIKIGHLSTGSPIDEVNDQKFISVYSDDQPLSIKYHPEYGKGIRKIVLKTLSSTSAYRLWLLW